MEYTPLKKKKKLPINISTQTHIIGGKAGFIALLFKAQGSSELRSPYFL